MSEIIATPTQAPDTEISAVIGVGVFTAALWLLSTVACAASLHRLHLRADTGSLEKWLLPVKRVLCIVLLVWSASALCLDAWWMGGRVKTSSPLILYEIVAEGFCRPCCYIIICAFMHFSPTDIVRFNFLEEEWKVTAQKEERARQRRLRQLQHQQMVQQQDGNGDDLVNGPQQQQQRQQQLRDNVAVSSSQVFPSSGMQQSQQRNTRQQQQQQQGRGSTFFDQASADESGGAFSGRASALGDTLDGSGMLGMQPPLTPQASHNNNSHVVAASSSSLGAVAEFGAAIPNNHNSSQQPPVPIVAPFPTNGNNNGNNNGASYLQPNIGDQRTGGMPTETDSNRDSADGNQSTVSSAHSSGSFGPNPFINVVFTDRATMGLSVTSLVKEVWANFVVGKIALVLLACLVVIFSIVGIVDAAVSGTSPTHDCNASLPGAGFVCVAYVDAAPGSRAFFIESPLLYDALSWAVSLVFCIAWWVLAYMRIRAKWNVAAAARFYIVYLAAGTLTTLRVLMTTMLLLVAFRREAGAYLALRTLATTFDACFVALVALHFARWMREKPRASLDPGVILL